ELLPGETQSRWDMAETFLRDNFNGTGGTCSAMKENYYGLFSFVKATIFHRTNSPGGGFSNAPITLLKSKTPGVPPIDWYGDLTNGLAVKLINDQSSGGYWYGHDCISGAQFPMDTAMSLLMLQQAIELNPIAVSKAT